MITFAVFQAVASRAAKTFARQLKRKKFSIVSIRNLTSIFEVKIMLRLGTMAAIYL